MHAPADGDIDTLLTRADDSAAILCCVRWLWDSTRHLSPTPLGWSARPSQMCPTPISYSREKIASNPVQQTDRQLNTYDVLITCRWFPATLSVCRNVLFRSKLPSCIPSDGCRLLSPICSSLIVAIVLRAAAIWGHILHKYVKCHKQTSQISIPSLIKCI